MLIAQSELGHPVEPLPGESAFCPSCKEAVLSKCGSVTIWHWAHKSKHDCDPWSEPESAWHIGWKQLFDKDCQEVVMPPHRADIRTANGTVIELQHSAISPEEIAEREAFYRNMIWIVDGAPFLENISYYPKAGYVKFKWKWIRSSWLSAKKPLFIDTRDGFLFQPVKIGTDGKGYGHFIPVSEILNEHGAVSLAVPKEGVRTCSSCRRNGVMDCRCQICGEMQ